MPERDNQPVSNFSRFRRAMWAAALVIGIFIASSRSEVAAPSGVVNLDKLAHFAVFGLLSTLMARIVFQPCRRWRSMLLAVFLASVYGVLDEWHQSFTPGRSVEAADWVADTSGALLAAALYCFWAPWRRLLEWDPRRRGRERKIRDTALTLPPAAVGDLGTK